MKVKYADKETEHFSIVDHPKEILCKNDASLCYTGQLPPCDRFLTEIRWLRLVTGTELRTIWPGSRLMARQGLEQYGLAHAGSCGLPILTFYYQTLPTKMTGGTLPRRSVAQLPILTKYRLTLIRGFGHYQSLPNSAKYYQPVDFIAIAVIMILCKRGGLIEEIYSHRNR